MEQDANDDQAVADFPAQKNCPNGKGQDVKVDKRNRNDVMVCIGDCADRP